MSDHRALLYAIENIVTFAYFDNSFSKFQTVSPCRKIFTKTNANSVLKLAQY